MKSISSMRIAFVGDLFISRRFTTEERKDLQPIRKYLHSVDCRFGNLETTLLRLNQASPQMFPGGGYAMASPSCLDDLKWLGFNLLNAATNHAMDYGERGCIGTIRNLRKKNISFAGIGIDLQDASAPVYFETPNGKVALLSVTSSFHDSYAAGPRNSEMIGRPGVAPLRHRAIYHLPKDDYETLRRIGIDTGINNYHDRSRKFGYLLPSDKLKFGVYDFVESKDSFSGVRTFPNESDLSRTLEHVDSAMRQSDIVACSIHSHQFKGDDVYVAPDFITDFAHECIDHGAKIVVCHGPHLLRGIEIYRQGIILHGVGNFIFQNEQQKYVPEEFYLKYGLSRDACHGPKDVFEKRAKNNTIGIIASTEEWRSAIFTLTFGLSRNNLEIRPLEISKKTGLPCFSRDLSILQHIRKYTTDSKRIEIDERNHIAKVVF